MARIFVAVRLPAALADEIETVQRALDRRLVDVKWVESENLHLTLRFFGDLDGGDVERVVQAVTAVSEATTPFTVRFEGIGTFPARGRPRVVWVGMTDGSDQLVAMALALEDAFVAADLGGADRPFAPHLTLGRVRDPNRRGRGGRLREKVPLQATAAMHAAVGEARFGPVAFELREIAVVESHLSPRGPTYLDSHVVRLGPTCDPDL